MIRVDRKPLTEEARGRYEARVLGPGLKWLEAHPPRQAEAGEARPKQARPPDYWREIREDLADAFHERCAYTAMWLSHPGQVDHFVSIDEERSRAYDWDNFRYCAGSINSSKQGIRSSQILDPLEIDDDWFEIILPSLELRVTDRCPEHLRKRAEFMLERLQLGRGHQVIRYRRQFYREYRPEDPSTLERLDRWAPLIARAIRKQQAQHAEAVSADEAKPSPP
ncbi:hypothetical protein [Sorangium sp. So ce131]|uniref:hypothetical protein n=1 Tax=Sorangium sp. So ce131 TaxID=3133282 RepID=UPI003F6123E2